MRSVSIGARSLKTVYHAHQTQFIIQQLMNVKLLDMIAPEVRSMINMIKNVFVPQSILTGMVNNVSIVRMV